MSSRKARRAWIAALRKHTRKGKIVKLEVRHDNRCLIYSAERICTCDPHRVILDKNGKVVEAIHGAGHYDPMELVGVMP